MFYIQIHYPWSPSDAPPLHRQPAHDSPKLVKSLIPPRSHHPSAIVIVRQLWTLII